MKLIQLYRTFSSWHNSCKFTSNNSTVVCNLVSGETTQCCKNNDVQIKLQLKDDCYRESGYRFASWWYHRWYNFFGKSSLCMFCWGSTFSFMVSLVWMMVKYWENSKLLNSFMKFGHIILVFSWLIHCLLQMIEL